MRVLVLLICLLAPATALACRGGAPCDQPGARQIQISVSHGKALPLPAGDQAAIAAILEASRTAMYEQLARECTLLLASIASSCRMTHANVSMNEARQSNPPYLQVNANGTYLIDIKGL